MYDSANAGGRKKRWAAAVGVLAAGAIGGGVLASALTASASGDTSTASPKLRQVRRAIPGLTWCFAGLAGWCSDRKITSRKWARGSGPEPGAVVGPGQGRYGSGGLRRDGDGVTQ